MPRRQHPRAVKICAHCGAGYDGFKAMESRGRYCSPGCLAAARAAHRHHPKSAASAVEVVTAISR